VPGEIVAAADGTAHLAPGSTATSFDPLRTPVELFGNVVLAVRGETVGEEILGSGDAGRAFQSFALKKKPLAWVEDASLADGRRPELIVRVDGFAWSHVATFFTAGPADRVYALRAEPDGGTRIVFGDGKRGARLPSGTRTTSAAPIGSAPGARPRHRALSSRSPGRSAG
jgi:hypothetical protein